MEYRSVETVVVGGGQAGLALSHELQRAGHEHVVLERGRTVERWRNERWDSLTLLSPNWMTRLPGQHYDGADPDGFMGRDDVVRFFERYARSFGAPVHEGVTVSSVDLLDAGPYAVQTDHGTWRAENVVIATGMYQDPKLPGWSRNLPAGVVQIHSSHYRHPGHLPPGAALVVGSGASGFQIAEELERHGRQVFFSVGRHERPPRRYRGKDTMWWLEQMGVFDQITASPVDRWQHPVGTATVLPPSPALTGVGGGHDLNPHQLASEGVVLLGRVKGIEDGALTIAPDLQQSLQNGDASYHAWRDRMEAYIQANAIVVPQDPPPAVYAMSPYEQSPIDRLDLRTNAISAVVWATGFQTDFSWIHAPVFGDDGHPVHYRGVTNTAGLYFLRIAPFYKRKATLIDGVEEDAAYIAERLIETAPLPSRQTEASARVPV
jgi:putative flavoprotein involved in K+ transport